MRTRASSLAPVAARLSSSDRPDLPDPADWAFGRRGPRPRCPRCEASRVHRWGRFAGRQRYRCRDCGRTFSELTGSPVAYSKRPWLWADCVRCLRDGLSIRAAAARLGVHPSTAFRWRHALLVALRARDRDRLVGRVEVASIRFPHSEKGRRRGLGRPPRRHGGSHLRAVTPRGATVLVACDRRGHVVGVVTATNAPARALGSHVLHVHLEPRLGRVQALIAEQGPWGPIATFARRLGVGFEDVQCRRRLRRAVTFGASPRTAAAVPGLPTLHGYLVRLRRWLLRFRGVATRYLDNYLAWHRVADRALDTSGRQWRRGRRGDVDLPWPLAVLCL